jgi:AAA+ ATPase superfamily predicted ATPase
MFFGRKQEMRRIEEMLSGVRPQCVSIIGERQIGKSSLTYRVFHTMKNIDNTLAVYLDCDRISGECQTKDQFFQVLNREFLYALEKKPEPLEVEEKGDNLFDSYSSFIEFLNRNVRKRITSIIFIDEFEHLPAQEFADDSFFSNLRAAANSPENCLAFVVITKIALKSLNHHHIKSSGFWNIFDEQVIGLLDLDSINRLSRYGFWKTNSPLAETEIEKIRYYAGDFPFFNQLVCYMIWDSKTLKKGIDWDRCEEKMRPYYEKLWEDRTEEEQKLLKNLKKITAINEPSLIDMEVRGLLVKEDRIYSPFSDYFSRLIDDFFVVNGVKNPPQGQVCIGFIDKKR